MVAAGAALGCQGLIEAPVGSGAAGDDPRGSSTPPDLPPQDPEARPELDRLFACEATDDVGPAPGRIVRLDDEGYRRTVEAALVRTGEPPLPVQEPPFALRNDADRFSNRATSYRVGEAEIESVLRSAQAIADAAAGRVGASCLGAGGELTSCLSPELADRGRLLFRRPLTDTEVAHYVGVADAAESAGLGREAAVAVALEAMLVSPSFLFRTELGTPDGAGLHRLTPHEVAEALSYSLTGGPPDERLRRMADDGSLAEPAVIEAEALRLLEDPQNNPAFLRFLREFFGYGDAPDIAKDQSAHPEHAPGALVEDTDRLVRALVATHARQGLFSALLTSELVFVQPESAYAYGLSSVDDPEEQHRMPGERAGVFTQPSWLVAFSDQDKNDPIRRGKFLRESFLCEDLPPLPIPDIEPLSPGPDQTLRETLAMHTENTACARCHEKMDPLGLPFEAFDHLGRFRTTELGRPVDTSGGLSGSGPDTDGAVDDPFELSRRMAESEVARQCFVAHAFEYWMGAVPTEAHGCALETADTLLQAEGDVVAMVAGFFASDAFLLRGEDSE